MNAREYNHTGRAMVTVTGDQGPVANAQVHIYRGAQLIKTLATNDKGYTHFLTTASGLPLYVQADANGMMSQKVAVERKDYSANR